jgi:hypothetical protein
MRRKGVAGEAVKREAWVKAPGLKKVSQEQEKSAKRRRENERRKERREKRKLSNSRTPLSVACSLLLSVQRPFDPSKHCRFHGFTSWGRSKGEGE